MQSRVSKHWKDTTEVTNEGSAVELLEEFYYLGTLWITAVLTNIVRPGLVKQTTYEEDYSQYRKTSTMAWHLKWDCTKPCWYQQCCTKQNHGLFSITRQKSWKLRISSGGDNWSYKSCKAPVKSSAPTNQHTVFLQAGCPSCHPTNNVKALKGKYHIP